VQVAAAAVPAVGVPDGTGVAEAEGATGWLLAVPDEFDGVAEGLGVTAGHGWSVRIADHKSSASEVQPTLPLPTISYGVVTKLILLGFNDPSESAKSCSAFMDANSELVVIELVTAFKTR